MAYQKLQSSKALEVVKSDAYNIPTGHVLASGTTTGTGTNTLVDTNASFDEKVIGCIVYNLTDATVTSVTGVTSASQLVLKEDVVSQAEEYVIFDKGRSDCVLFVGGEGNIKVTTSSGSTVTFNGIAAGTFIPVSVLKVWATGTTATNVIALW